MMSLGSVRWLDRSWCKQPASLSGHAAAHRSHNSSGRWATSGSTTCGYWFCLLAVCARGRRSARHSELRPKRCAAAALPRFRPDALASELAEALRVEGCSIVDGLATPQVMLQALAELESVRLAPGQRFGRETMIWERPLDPVDEVTLLSLQDCPLIADALELLRPIHGAGSARCMPFELRWLDLGPNSPEMRLHRDQVDSTNPPLERPLQWGVNVIWAATDFTCENGATRMVPGSHSKDRPQGAWTGDSMEQGDDLAIQAIMPAGSAVIYYASTMHGSGINSTCTVRSGLNFNYCYVDQGGGRPAGWGW